MAEARASRKKTKVDGTEAGRALADDMAAILKNRELTPTDLAEVLERAQTLGPEALKSAIDDLYRMPTPRRVPAGGDPVSTEPFNTARKKMRANTRQRLILKQLTLVYGTGERAMFILREISKLMGYREPSEADLKIAGHYAGAQHAGAVIAVALGVEPFDLWPKVLSAAGAAQGIYARDFHQLKNIRDVVVEAFHETRRLSDGR
jgi:hypothetical protein